MSKKTNPALIGAFVITGLIIAVAAIFILGSGKLFKEIESYVLYFEEDMSGLDVGAPVEYGGVRIGAVTDIRFEYYTEDNTILIPVYIEIDRSRISIIGEESEDNDVQLQIQQGLRAQLQSQSFVTGKLKIMLVMAPKTPINLIQHDLSVIEVPTIPSMFEDLEKSLEALPIEDIVENLNSITRSFAEITDAKKINAILSELEKTSTSIAEMASSPELKETAKSLRNTLAETETLAGNLNASISPVQQELTASLRELAETARAARSLLDYLERHPETIIYGKKGE
jgi:paraquat-inducible protein B